MRKPTIISRPYARASVLAVSLCAVALAATAGRAEAAPGVTISRLLGAPTEEGDAVTMTLRLDAPNATPVTLELTASGPGAVTIEPATVTFAPGAWVVPHTVRIAGVDNELESGNQAVTIHVAVAPGSDPAYAGLPPVDQNLTVLDDEETLVIESAPIECVGPTSEDIYAGQVTSTHYDRTHPAAAGLAFDLDDPGQDDLLFPEHSDERMVALRTLHVILRNTLGVQMTEPGIRDLSRRYATAAHQIHVASGALLRLEHEQVVIDDWYGEWAFSDPRSPQRGGFDAYHALRVSLLLAGHDVDDYDIVNISVPIMQSQIAPVAPPNGYSAAYAVPSDPGPTFGNSQTWGNGRTWTTVQFAASPSTADMRDIFMHELNHTVEWMLELGVFLPHRNADDPWWLATYPTYVPGSSGFGKIDVLTMFWARPKMFYDGLTDDWGELRFREPKHVVETSCVDAHTLQLRRQYCAHGVACDLPWLDQLPGRCRCVESPRGADPGRGGGR